MEFTGRFDRAVFDIEGGGADTDFADGSLPRRRAGRGGRRRGRALFGEQTFDIERAVRIQPDFRLHPLQIDGGNAGNLFVEINAGFVEHHRRQTQPVFGPVLRADGELVGADAGQIHQQARTAFTENTEVVIARQTKAAIAELERQFFAEELIGADRLEGLDFEITLGG